MIRKKFDEVSVLIDGFDEGFDLLSGNRLIVDVPNCISRISVGSKPGSICLKHFKVRDLLTKRLECVCEGVFMLAVEHIVSLFLFSFDVNDLTHHSEHRELQVLHHKIDLGEDLVLAEVVEQRLHAVHGDCHT
jgi:hypothetical protein